MTPIPNLPTDNFYKFSFLGGIAIIILTSFFSITQYQTINEKFDNYELEVIKLNTENGILHEDLGKIDEAVKKLDIKVSELKPTKKDINKDEAEMIKKLNNKNYREKIAFLSEHEKYLFPYIADYEELVNKTEQYKEKKNQLNLNEEILQFKKSHLNREVYYQSYLIFVSVLLYIFGVYITVYGRHEWLRLQKIADEKNEIELAIMKKHLSQM